MKRFLLVSLIPLLLFGSACSTRVNILPMRNNVTQPHGFYVDGLPGENWYLIDVVDGRETIIMLYRRRVEPAGHSVVFVAQRAELDEAPDSLDAFYDAAREHVWTMGFPVEWVETRPEWIDGHSCLRYRAIGQLRIEEKDGGHRPGRVISDGRLCQHPDWPRTLLDVAYSENTSNPQFNESYRNEAMPLVDSLRFLTVREPPADPGPGLTWTQNSVPQPGAPDGRRISTNIRAPGSLEATRRIGCVPVASLDTEVTPADLYPAVLACMKENQLAAAADLFALAMMRGRFDALRVTDRTAHQGVANMKIRYLEPLAKQTKDALSKAAVARFEMGSAEQSLFCSQMRDLGPPTYYPRYMIQHGMAAIRDTGAVPLVASFDPKAAWVETIDGYGKCASVPWDETGD